MNTVMLDRKVMITDQSLEKKVPPAVDDIDEAVSGIPVTSGKRFGLLDLWKIHGMKKIPRVK